MLDLVLICCSCFVFLFFKQKTAYEMRISDWSSDVCSSDLYLMAKFQAFRILDKNIVLSSFTDTYHDRRRGCQAQRTGTGDNQYRNRSEQGMRESVLSSERSEERRVGKECVSPCRCRGST